MTPDQVLEAVERAMTRDWEWGVADCCGGASAAFASLWGVWPMPGLRGRYRTARGAQLLLQRRGGSMDAMAATEFAGAGLVCAAALPGSIGLGPSGAEGFGGRAVMLCVTPGWWAGKTERGFAVVRQDAEGWSCPH